MGEKILSVAKMTLLLYERENCFGDSSIVFRSSSTVKIVLFN